MWGENKPRAPGLTYDMKEIKLHAVALSYIVVIVTGAHITVAVITTAITDLY